jgi:RNA polymerase sigma-70 factor (ECF subfamily)
MFRISRRLLVSTEEAEDAVQEVILKLWRNRNKFSDYKNLEAYATHLESISKYKSPELVDKAKSVNIPIESNGKKKVKKQLYDEINMYYLNNVV